MTSNRTGTGKTFYPTTNSTTVKKSNPYSAVLNATSHKTASVQHVMLRFSTFHGMTEGRNPRFAARSVKRISHPLRITVFPKPLNYAAPTVPTSLFLKKTAGTSSYINV